MSDHLEGLDANQKKALHKGLSALEAMADIWSAEVGLHGIAEKIADVPLERRVEFIKTMVLQGFIEGAYRHYIDHKDACDEIDRLKGGSHE